MLPAPVQFVLAGSHGIVYPWMPPAGIPLFVWERMKDALKTQLDTAVQSERVPASQTNRGSVLELPPTVPGLLRGLKAMRDPGED